MEELTNATFADDIVLIGITKDTITPSECHRRIS